MDKKHIKKIKKIIRDARKILIIVSRPIDYDCLASGVVMYNYLKKMNKVVQVTAPTFIPEQFYELPQIKKITIHDTRKFNFSSYDLIIPLDGGNTKQFAEVSKDEEFSFGNNKNILSIDHHAGATDFAKYALYDKEASSTAELLLSTIIDIKKVSRDEATLLYSALVWDTGNFLHNFTHRTLKIASQLIKQQADYVFVLDHILHSHTEEDFKLFAWLIEHTVYDYDRGYSYVVFDPKKAEKKFQCHYPVIKHAVKLYTTYFATDVSGISIAFILWQQGRRVRMKIKGSSYRNNIPLTELSKALGGGGEGHFQYAPTDIIGTVNETLKKIPKAIKKLRKKYKNNS
jgi:nanoRNase/pAp phosphatase (c-di-AMP/oligoRNAs hydrolase)